MAFQAGRLSFGQRLDEEVHPCMGPRAGHSLLRSHTFIHSLTHTTLSHIFTHTLAHTHTTFTHSHSHTHNILTHIHSHILIHKHNIHTHTHIDTLYPVGGGNFEAQTPCPLPFSWASCSQVLKEDLSPLDALSWLKGIQPELKQLKGWRRTSLFFQRYGNG